MYNRVLFIGSKESGLKVLKSIHERTPEILVGCVTVDDKKESRSKLNEFVSFCDEKNIDLHILNGKCDLSESIFEFKPDICFVMGWYYIISEKVINSVKGGIIGIHNSLLPAHRGFAPVVWTMIGGEKETGFSVFSFDKGMDTGDIWYQEKIEIKDEDYISDVLNKIDERVSAFFDKCYQKIIDGTIIPYKQKENGITYGAKRVEEDGVIDWSKTSSEIYDFIRAQSKPYSGAYTFYKGEKVVIFKSEIFPYKIQGSIGQVGIIDNEKQEIVIVCGNNTGLVINKVEIDGKEIAITDKVKSLSYRMEM